MTAVVATNETILVVGGGISGMTAALEAAECGKDIILVEVAYNWRRAEYRDEPGPFPETPAGQRQFLAEVDQIVRQTPHGRRKGIFCWEPAVPRSPIASRGMFDDEEDVRRKAEDERKKRPAGAKDDDEE